MGIGNTTGGVTCARYRIKLCICRRYRKYHQTPQKFETTPIGTQNSNHTAPAYRSAGNEDYPIPRRTCAQWRWPTGMQEQPPHSLKVLVPRSLRLLNWTLDLLILAGFISSGTWNPGCRESSVLRIYQYIHVHTGAPPVTVRWYRCCLLHLQLGSCGGRLRQSLPP